MQSRETKWWSQNSKKYIYIHKPNKPMVQGERDKGGRAGEGRAALCRRRQQDVGSRRGWRAHGNWLLEKGESPAMSLVASPRPWKVLLALAGEHPSPGGKQQPGTAVGTAGCLGRTLKNVTAAWSRTCYIPGRALKKDFNACESLFIQKKLYIYIEWLLVVGKLP